MISTSRTRQPVRRTHRPLDLLLTIALAAALVLGLNATPAAAATTITVNTAQDELNSDGDCALREAIRAANSNSAVDACPAGSGTDTITLPAGVYTLTRTGADEDAAATGDLDITQSLTINGAGAASTIIDGGAIDRVLDIFTGATVSLNNLTARNGRTTAVLASNTTSREGRGGGIYNLGALTLTNSVVSSNNVFPSETGEYRAGIGGGIYSAGSLTLTNSTIEDNRIDGGDYSGSIGGGVYNSGSLTLTNSTLRGNLAESPDYDRSDEQGIANGIYHVQGALTMTGGQLLGDSVLLAGQVSISNTTVYGFTNSATMTVNGVTIHGGLSNSGTLTLTDSIIRDGQDTFGCGIYGDCSPGFGGGVSNSGTLTIVRSVIRDNVANYGGGIYSFGTLTISDSLITANQAQYCPRCIEDEDDSGLPGGNGGGLFVGGNVTIINTTISGNTADVDGGGLDVSNTATLNNVTIANNIADDDQDSNGSGGGIKAGSVATVNLRNTLIAGNTARTGYPPDCSGSLVSQGYNLIQQPRGCTLTGTLTGNLLSIDPKLGPLQNNGGATATHALLVGSPAIDAGNPATPGGAAPACPATDQRGIARPQGVFGAARCDIGAFELAGGSNILLNGGFEADANNDGAPDNWSANGAASLVSSPRLEGQRALRHSSTSNASYTIFSDGVAVVPGQPYSFRASVNIPATSDQFSFQLQVRWRAGDGSVLADTVVKTYTAATNGWDLASASLVAYPNSAYATVRMVVTSLNATVYVDNVAFQPVASRLSNGSFDIDADYNGIADGWSNDPHARLSNEQVHSYPYALRHQATDNASYTIFSDSAPSVIAGQPYAFAAWLKILPTSDTFSFQFQVRWRDAAGNVISTESVGPNYTTAPSGLGWTSVSASLIAPPNATQATVRQVVGSLNATIYVDDVTLGP
jgi:CSLREA domain-containing protein